MKIRYTCDGCGAYIDAVEVDQLDECRFGFDCLTPAERQDIIKVDAAANVMEVRSLCDDCIAAMGLDSDGLPPVDRRLLH